MYEISYMWYSAIACMFCMVVGMIVSLLTKPQDPKTLNPDLISPNTVKLFAFWPRCVREKIEDIYSNVGVRYVRQKRDRL